MGIKEEKKARPASWEMLVRLLRPGGRERGSLFWFAWGTPSYDWTLKIGPVPEPPRGLVGVADGVGMGPRKDLLGMGLCRANSGSIGEDGRQRMVNACC